jgi:predicted dehydrogenase
MKAGIVGLGARSTAYLPLISGLPGGRVSAVCDIDEGRMQRYIETFLPGKKPALATRSHLELMRSDEVDTVFICTPDTTHRALLEDAVASGRHILLEKPVATTIADARAVYEAGKEYTNALAVGFVLRYTPVYSAIHDIVKSGRLGRVVSMTAKELLDARHAGSFYRRWNRFTRLTGGLMNAKCCHDLDILNWLAGADPESVSAFGGRGVFNPIEGAAERCAVCKLADTCKYAFDYEYYESMYRGFVSASDLCVYNTEKDIVDHEIMNIRYGNGVVAQFELGMFAPEETRTLLVFGTEAALEADFAKATIRLRPLRGPEEIIVLDGTGGGHGGGDGNIVEALWRAQEEGLPLNHARAGFLSTAVALAGEESMARGGNSVNMEDFAGL